MCRAGPDRRPRGRRSSRPRARSRRGGRRGSRRGSPASRANAAAGSSPSGATAIRPRSRSVPASSTAAARPSRSAGSAPARPVAPGGSRLTWSRHVDRRATALVRARGRAAPTSLTPVDGLHDVGVRRDGGRLVALQPADEVPAQAEVGALGGLGLGLLVAVLPHVGDAEVGQQPHVGGGEELGDDDQAHVVGVAAGAGAGAGDPRGVRREAGGDLVARGSRGHRHDPDQAGEAAGGGAVAAVGVEVGGLAGAARRRRRPRRRRARAGRGRRRRGRARACPRRSRRGLRHDRRDLVAHLLGHLVAARRTRAGRPRRSAGWRRARASARPSPATTPATRPGRPAVQPRRSRPPRGRRAAPGRSRRPGPSAPTPGVGGHAAPSAVRPRAAGSAASTDDHSSPCTWWSSASASLRGEVGQHAAAVLGRGRGVVAPEIARLSESKGDALTPPYRR